MNFKDFYNNFDEMEKKANKVLSEEEIFEKELGIPLVDTLKTFIAWMVVHGKVKPNIKVPHRKRPVSIFEMNTSKKILYLVKTVPDIKKYAKEFNMKWGKTL